MDFFQDGACRLQAEAGSVKFFRYQDRQKPCLGQRSDELGRIGALTVELLPVLAWKLRT